MGRTPHGPRLILGDNHPVMNNRESLCVEFPAEAPLRHQTTSPRRILVVDNDNDPRQFVEESLIPKYLWPAATTPGRKL